MRVEALTDRIPQPAQPTAVGAWGTDVLEKSLRALPDAWAMLHGYRNRSGEIDHVVVGPGGLWLVGVKRHRIRLHAEGDDWWYETLDQRGRIVGRAWAMDSGRNWARQALEVAADLDAWLRRNGCQVVIRTAVLVLHEKAQLGRCSNVSVTLVGSHPRHLLQALVNEPPTLSAGACEQIVKLVKRDHRHHQNRRHAR